jgi:hypothetical protein
MTSIQQLFLYNWLIVVGAETVLLAESTAEQKWSAQPFLPS